MITRLCSSLRQQLDPNRHERTSHKPEKAATRPDLHPSVATMMLILLVSMSCCSCMLWSSSICSCRCRQHHSVLQCVTATQESSSRPPKPAQNVQPPAFRSTQANQNAVSALPMPNCTGGPNLVPEEQYWHSASNSDYIIRCPNGDACRGNRSQLLSCKRAAYMQLAGEEPVRYRYRYGLVNKVL